MRAPLTRRPLSVCFEEGSPHFENDNTSIYLRVLLGSFLIRQLSSEKLIPIGNRHPQGSFPVGQLPSGRFIPIWQLSGSSPIGQLSSRRFIPDWATTFVCAFWEGKPHSRIIAQTSISGFLRLILNGGNCLPEGSSLIEQLPTQLRSWGLPLLGILWLCVPRWEVPTREQYA